MPFHYQDRGYKETVILIPGWGTCPLLLAPLYSDYNQLLCIKPSPHDFVSALTSTIKQQKIKNITCIAGFSLGGFLALDVLKCADFYPLFHKLQVHLHAIREYYPKLEVMQVRKQLLKNPTAFMQGFFEQEFSLGEQPLFQGYLDQLNLDHLLIGLDYLARVHVDSVFLNRLLNQLDTGLHLTFFHGKRDRIAPVREIRRIISGVDQQDRAQLVLKTGGHFGSLITQT
eukprot:COSAG01_NODE_1_length_100484_cov_170.446142_9_plen_228_part_00